MSGAPPEADARPRKRSQATELVDLVDDIEFFHTSARETYAAVPLDGHRETWRLRDVAFRTFLARRYFATFGGSPGGQAVQDALNVLEGKALFDGGTHDVFVRVAEHEGEIVLDLGDRAWRAVVVSPWGWSVTTDPPVRFRRPPGLLALPEPQQGGTVDELRPFLNISDGDWQLAVSWVLASLRPRGPYPVLGLQGEQGAAKSTTARVLRSLVDPNEVPLRSQPRDEANLQIAARNGWVILLDNLSGLPGWLSDALCRLSTGGGITARQLYTDADEILFRAQRPVLLTGIEDLATRGDLLDRSLIVRLPPIGRDRYRAEAEFWAEFEEARPRIVGAFLDVTADALRRLPTLQQRDLPRMADFALWIAAAETALDWEPGGFEARYSDKRADSHMAVLEGSPIATPLLGIADDGFLGTATDLLAQLGGMVDDDTKHKRGWPGNGRALSNTLRRLAPTLRAVGVEVEFEQRLADSDSNRGIRVSRARAETDASTDAKSPDGRKPDATNEALRPSSNGSSMRNDDFTDATDANEPSFFPF